MQFWHCVDPTPPAYVPLPQARQASTLVAPVDVPYLPALHEVHFSVATVAV